MSALPLLKAMFTCYSCVLAASPSYGGPPSLFIMLRLICILKINVSLRNSLDMLECYGTSTVATYTKTDFHKIINKY